MIAVTALVLVWVAVGALALAIRRDRRQWQSVDRFTAARAELRRLSTVDDHGVGCDGPWNCVCR